MSSASDEYDALPFVGEAVPHAHPEFLETVARLRGLAPAPAATARVLELGCGVGSNLLPMADRYPEARFLGIDLSARQIDMARSLAAESELANVEFRQADILELGPELGQFDYVFTHGVYSWVEQPVRDKLLALSRVCLARQGVAYVGYKTYPGWQAFEQIRAAMLERAQNAGSRHERIAAARSALATLERVVGIGYEHPQLVRNEVARLKRSPDDYLWHEYLEAVNFPVFFPQFVEHAKAHGLQYLGDGAVGVRWFDQLGGEQEKQAASAGDPFEAEKNRDIARNRSFRQTLLCRDDASPGRAMTADAMLGLYVEGAFLPANARLDLCAASNEVFVHRLGGRVATTERLLKAALVHLGQAWPGFVRFDELIAAAHRRLAEAGWRPLADEVEKFEGSLAQCCAMMILQLHAHAALFAASASEKPATSVLARVQARHGSQVSNRRHEPVTLSTFERWLVGQLDGQTTPLQLIERAAADCASGTLKVLRPAGPLRDPRQAVQHFAREVPAALKHLAQAALLVG